MTINDGSWTIPCSAIVYFEPTSPVARRLAELPDSLTSVIHQDHSPTCDIALTNSDSDLNPHWSYRQPRSHQRNHGDRTDSPVGARFPEATAHLLESQGQEGEGHQGGRQEGATMVQGRWPGLPDAQDGHRGLLHWYARLVEMRRALRRLMVWPDKKCPFTGMVSIRGRILTGTVVSTKMHRTLIIRREYLHFVPKYQRYEKRHKNLAAHVSPCFRVEDGDVVTVGQCRPLSKTVGVSPASWGLQIRCGLG